MSLKHHTKHQASRNIAPSFPAADQRKVWTRGLPSGKTRLEVKELGDSYRGVEIIISFWMDIFPCEKARTIDVPFLPSSASALATVALLYTVHIPTTVLAAGSACICTNAFLCFKCFNSSFIAIYFRSTGLSLRQNATLLEFQPCLNLIASHCISRKPQLNKIGSGVTHAVASRLPHSPGSSRVSSFP